ncbi:hypothetical protein XH98_13990 [Bradyrhizobium sp. CCBAU 51745]|nr:hypothetical protein [Bradyrhizobium sp. CCBAU 51745]
MISRERKQSKMIVVDTMSGRRTWSAVVNLSEIVGGLLLAGFLGRAIDEASLVGRNVVDRPVMPGTAWSIRVIAEKDVTARSLRRT